MNKTAVLVAIAIFLACSNSFAEGLQTLMEVGKNMEETKKALDEETKAFGRVKAGIERGAIKKGDTKDKIMKECGEPVIATHDKKTDRDEWAYMPAKSTFFKGIKIYLYFTKDGALDESKVTE